MNNLHASLTAETKRLLGLGYKVMPVRHKASMTSIYKEDFENYNGNIWPGQTGIAIVCSQESGVLALDIDVDDQSLIDAILNIAPSNVIKIGGKGLTAFYQMPESIEKKASRSYEIVNPNESERKEKPYLKVGVFDLLANNTITVMPPSQHFITDKVNDTNIPSGKYYRYESSPLPEKDYLPTICQAQVDSILAILDSYCMERNQSGNSHTSIKHGGRNDKLTAIASAVLFREANLIPYTDLVNTAANEVYEYDKLNHSPRLFTQASEGFKAKDEKDAVKNSVSFTKRILKSIETQILSDNQLSTKTLSEVNKIGKFEYKDYPTPFDGALSCLQRYIMESSYTKNPNMALGSAIATIGTLIGNKVSFDKTFCNDYYILLSAAGGGKSSAINAIKDERIISDNNLYPGSFTSSQAVIKTVTDGCELLVTNDEMSKLLKQIKNGNEWQQGIVQELASIWSASGGRYELQAQSVKAEEKDKMKKFVTKPFMSFLGATTFSELIDNVDNTMFSSGMFPRCLFFIDKEYDSETKFKLNYKEQDYWLEATLKAIEIMNVTIKQICGPRATTIYGILSDEFPTHNLESDNVDNRLEEIHKELIKLKAMTEVEHLRLMYSRGLEHVKKLSLISAIARLNEEVEVKDIDWAFEMFKTSIYNAGPTFNIAASQGYNDKIFHKGIALLKRKGQMTKTEFANSLRLSSKLAQQLLEDLISRDYVVKFKDKTNNGRSVDFFSVKEKDSE